MAEHECRCGVSPSHATFGACMRAKNLRISGCREAVGRDTTYYKQWRYELDAYDSAVAQGINPEGTTLAKIREAELLSEAAGVPYGTPAFEAEVDQRMKEHAA